MKLHTWNQLSEKEKQSLLQRPILLNDKKILSATQNIIDRVKSEGDQALLSLTQQFDHASLSENRIHVSKKEIKKAQQLIDKETFKAIRFAYQQIKKYHQSQKKFKTPVLQTQAGVYCERQQRPIDRVGLYVPGGSAPLVSTVLMLAIPAQLAQCPLTVLCTPPDRNGEINPYLIMAAQLCGIEKIYKVGGAQAIAAMAYGTESIPKVDKIFGPGNVWVTQAKLIVSQDSQGASIDLPAGPSEVMIIADNEANPNYVAADLLSQAEHGPDSQVILLALSKKYVAKVEQAIEDQLQKLPRHEIIEKALKQSQMIIVEDIEQAIAINNQYAPEHLVLQIKNPKRYTSRIKNAGSVFLGPWSAVTLGDYITGSNHVLPTGGFARCYSGLSVLDFMKFVNFQRVTQEGLKKIASAAIQLAKIENMSAHGQAVAVRNADI